MENNYFLKESHYVNENTTNRNRRKNTPNSNRRFILLAGSRGSRPGGGQGAKPRWKGG